MYVALDEFLTRVKSIEGTINLVDRLVEFGLIAPRQVNVNVTPLHRSVRGLGVSGIHRNLDGSVLLITAAFEQFVSDLMVAFAAQLPERVPAYSNLPNAIRSANERLTGEALNRSRTRFTEYELQRFVENLANCHAGVAPYVLNGEAIALNERNVRSGTLRELFSRLGVNDVWTTVASTRTLKNWSGPGGAKSAKSRAENQLNELMNARNHIAHRVGSTTLGPDAIRAYIRFVRFLARSLVKGLENYAGSLQSS